MKKLILMRHGKSSWKDSTLSDFDRPLKKRGQHDVPLMAKLLKSEDLVPDLILSSPAVRCRDTVELSNQVFGLPEEKVVWVDGLYMADIDDYYEAINQFNHDEKVILICGHNPSMEALLQSLTGNIDVLSSAGVAYIKLNIEQWNEIAGEDPSGKLKGLWLPKGINE